MATILWSTLTAGSTLVFDPATDVLRFDSTSISAADFGMISWIGDDVTFSVSGKSDAGLNKTVHLTVTGGVRALADTNVIYDSGSRLLVGDNTTSVGDGTSTFDDAANSLTGTAGRDCLLGLGGNDTLTGGLGADSLDGGAGLDAAAYRDATSGVRVDLFNPANNTGEAAGDRFSSIEGIIGSAFNDMGNLVMYGAIGLAIILVPFYLSARSSEKRNEKR